MFFAISGFLITTLMLREQRQAGRLAIGRFYVRRCLRIFPLYYTVLALYVLRAWIFLPHAAPRAHFFRSLPFYASYTSNWFVDFAVPHPVIFAFAWSLATEEQFYALWPCVVRWSRGWRVPVFTALVLLTLSQGVAWGFFTGVFPPATLLRRIVGSIAPPMCLGVLLAYALNESRSFGFVAKLLGHRASAPLLLLALAALVSIEGVPLLAIHLAMALLLGACCVRADHGLSLLTDAAPIRWVGTVSYGIYLMHVSAVTAARRLLPSAWSAAPVIFATAFAATLGVASLSYLWFERPYLRLRESFR
jgi:peptidoglycan/LPS O-acetylase OafA/YrhL